MTHQLKRLVQYKEDGNKLDSHDNVPEDVRQELHATEQQRLERQQQAAKGLTKSLPSIQITNVLPSGASTSSSGLTTDEARSANDTAAGRSKRLKIPGQRDLNVRRYTRWQQSHVHDRDMKTKYENACTIVLKHGWDLEQLEHQEHTVPGR